MLSTLFISFSLKYQETLIEFHIKLKVLICPNSLSSPFSLIPFQLADNHCFVSLVLINIKIILLHLCHCMTLSRAFYPCTGIYMFVPSLSLLVILKTFSNCYFICFHFIVSLKQNLTLLSFHIKAFTPDPCSSLIASYKKGLQA